jgi:hypothetical protein
MLPCLVSVLLTFVLKFEKKIRRQKVNMPFEADRAQLANLAVLHSTQKIYLYRSVTV